MTPETKEAIERLARYMYGPWTIEEHAMRHIHAVGPEPELDSLCGVKPCGYYDCAGADSELVNCDACLKALGRL